ncbi:MAG: MBL fold metallo-hydrolase [Alphaproteobacteria bacterium]|nr:MBL fold metallo-hydrolase [Alphaproteobacteria bacterium]
MSLLLAMAWLLARPALAGDMTVDMIDVGQGDAILITSPEGKRVLIDGGVAKANVAEQLRRMGVTELAMVVATHPHADHIGGLEDVLDNFVVKAWLDNGLPHSTRTYTDLMAAVEAEGLTYRAAQEGQVYRLDDGITLTVLWPGDKPITGTRSDLNSNSVILRLDHGEDCFLFTGDAEDPSERAIMRRELQPCDVLKVAHHGSDHSTSTQLLNMVQPEIALISVGEDNRYGHPGDETIRRLQKARVRIYRTDYTGHVTLLSTGAGVEVIDGLPWWEPESPRVSAPSPSVKAADGWGGGEPEAPEPGSEPPPPLAPTSTRRSCLGPLP